MSKHTHFFSKKFYFSLLLLMFVIAASAMLRVKAPVFAQGTDTVSQGLAPLEATGLSNQDVRLTIAKLIRVFLGLLGIIFIVLIVYAGYLWITSGGNKEILSRAKDTLKNAVIGLAIILSAYAIVSYVINLLLEAVAVSGEETPLPPGYNGRGALGAGIIQSHYPTRDARDVPRNTNIIITLKIPMDLDSIADRTETNITPGPSWDDTYILKTENIQIFFSDKDPNDAANLFTARVYTIQTEFDAQAIKTIVIDPDHDLGSASAKIKHTVALREGMKTKAGETPFSPESRNYLWQFETSLNIDIIAPYIMDMEVAPGYAATPIPNGGNIPYPQGSNDPSAYQTVYDAKRLNAQVLPEAKAQYGSGKTCNEPHADTAACKKWPRNVLIQVNFSEAVNPIVTAGRSGYINVFQYKNDNDPNTDEFVNSPQDDPSDDWLKVSGEWKLSSDYKTAEFWPDEKDGFNSCGDTIYILPENAMIRAAIKTATPRNTDPLNPDYTPQAAGMDGVVDVANNAFDGNADTYATGASGTSIPDDFIWLFDTSSSLDLTSPLLIKLGPLDHASYVDKGRFFIAEFSKNMSATTLLPNDTIFMKANKRVPNAWCRCDPGQAAQCPVEETNADTEDDGNCIPLQGNVLTAIGSAMFDSSLDSNADKDQGRIYLQHELLQQDPAMDYSPVLTKDIKDAFQNCFEAKCLAKAGNYGQEIDYNEPATGPQGNPVNPVNSGCSSYSTWP